jgi:phosphomannomutase
MPAATMSALSPSIAVPGCLVDLPQAAWLDEIMRWCNDPRYAEDRPALAALLAQVEAGDAAARAELEDAFSGPLPIGTGGRRGAVGPGSNRMNASVVRETAQAVAELIAQEGAPKKVAIAFDTRTHSRAFARTVAEQLAACDVSVVLMDEPRPTPQLAFVVRREGCGAGVVISASHNPPGDNGIKIYGSDGAQVLGDRDRRLMAAIEAAMTATLQTFEAADAVRIEVAGTPGRLDAIDAAYHACVRAQCVLGDLARSNLRVVFTPLHGVGHTALLPLLREKGVDVAVVEAQLPDGGLFATVKSANPEVPDSLALAVAQAEATNADLVLATDPDADRLGAVARNERGELEFIDGNRMGVLLLDHVLRHAKRGPEDWVLTTLLTSSLIGTLARAAGVEVVDDLLVGFKHHAGMMDERPERRLLFACEESHGFVRGNDVHDKDGAIAGLLLAEAAAWAKDQGRTLHGQLAHIHAAHGYHRERTANLYAYGAAGREAIAGLLATWRREPPRELGGLAVVAVEDRSKPRNTGSPTRDLPSNVLVFDLQSAGDTACRLLVRPSGTEPKAKVYALGRGAAAPIGPQLDRVAHEVDEMVDRVLADAQGLAEAIMRGAP